MNQEDFRRKLSALDLESIRKLSAKKPKKKDRSKERKSSVHDDAKITTLSRESQYRDRAAERRQGIQGADDMDDLTNATPGEQVQRAPVAKGLDFGLLAQLKREKERLERATAAAKDQARSRIAGDQVDDNPAREPTFKTRLGRLVYFHALQAPEEQSTKSDLFLPGRLTYTFDLTSSALESVPTAVQRSKEDCPEPDDVLCGQVDDIVISRISVALETKRHHKHARRKGSAKESSMGNESHMKSEESTSGLTSDDKANTIEPSQDSDDDIFPDAGEYVPAYMRDDKSAAESVSTAKRVDYFSDLSASLTAAEAAERQKEKEADEAWRATLKKAVIAQSQAEREKEMKARAAKLAAQQDTYSECFPEYQAAAAEDSDDEEATSKKKRKGASQTESNVDEEELSRRKKQKHQNKLENDLHKINKVRTGGKGTVRRKKKAAHKATAADDKKLSATLKKLGVTNIPGVEEVNLFKADGQVIHFAAPKVQASIASNTYAVSGHCATKSLQELLPGIINQLGPDNLANLKQIAESYTAAQKAAKAAAPADDEDDDDVPDLVDNFEDVSQQD
ncbi:hypothetical protein ATCC90586_008370 [Pythium insidiosum]|nr:hypothetical protein ATCC90586_008370 [Pythium insidiosum]